MKFYIDIYSIISVYYGENGHRDGESESPGILN